MLTIYGIPFSVHTRKVSLAASFKGLPYRLEPVFPFDPPAQWRSLSPTGLIPAIQDGDFTLADSTAICLYLERAYVQNPLLPQDAKQLGQALFIDAYAGDTLFRNVVHSLFFQKVLRPKVLSQETDQAAVDQILDGVRPTVFSYLDSIAGGAHLVGERQTLADLAVVSNLLTYSYLGLEIERAKFPRLAQYFKRQIASDLVGAAIAAERPAVEEMQLDRSLIAA
ncbi:MAG: glutathione S-transferase family protein [Ferrovibrio sp.]